MKTRINTFNTTWPRLVFTLIAGLLIGMIGMISGCADKCKDQYCLNGGDCLDGDCQCPSGYYGTHCEYFNGGGGGGGGNTGTLMFWSNQYGSPVNVSISGYSGTISSYYNTTQYDPPSCGSSGCFNITLAYGSYSYTASDGTHNWSGTANVTASCNRMLLYW